jgi:NADH-quinone oxidoreductase subunit N
MTDIVFPGVALGGLLPALIVLGTAGLVLLLDLAPPRDTKTHLGGIALGGIVAALLVAVTRWGTEQRAFRDMVLLDNYALFFDLVICYAAALVVMLSMDYLGRTGGESGEYYGLVLFATAGMMLMVSAGDLIVVFLSLELMSLSLYVLAGLFKTRLASGEASLKYFLLGAFASSFLLYGIALIYGATGSTSLDRIAASPAAKNADPLVLAGLGLMLVGFGFKISSVPFQHVGPTCTRARRPRSRPSSPRDRRPPPSRRSSACWWWRCVAPRPTGRRCCGKSRAGACEPT